MNRKYIALAAAASAGVALSLLPGTGAAQEATGGAPVAPLELVGRDREGTFRFVDNPPKQKSQRQPPSAGDLFVIKQPLRDGRNRRRVGRVFATFVVLGGKSVRANVTATFDLRRGDITVQGTDSERRRVTFAITGATGIYRDLEGTLTVISRRRTTRFVFNFRRD